MAIQYLKGSYGKEEDGLFSKICSDRRRKNGFKLKENRFRLDIRKRVFYSEGRHWNMFPRDVVDAPSLETFKARVDKALGSQIWL